MGPNAVISVGTCFLSNTFCSGDTTVAIIGPNVTSVSNLGVVSTIPGGQLAYNDDGPSAAGCGLCSYVAPYTYNGSAATLSVAVSCYAGACAGQLAISVKNFTTMPPPPPPRPPTVAPGATQPCAYLLSPSQKYAECNVTVPPMVSLMAGTCFLAGASCTNASSLVFMDSQANVLASNSVAASSSVAPTAQPGCGSCSLVQPWQNLGSLPVVVTVRQMCAAAGLMSCSGVTALQLRMNVPPPPPSPPPPSPAPPIPPSYESFSLDVTDESKLYAFVVPPLVTVTLGTCSVIPGASCIGDTYVSAVVADTAVTFDNDNAPGCGLCSVAGPWTNNGADDVTIYATVYCGDPTETCSGVFGYALSYPSPPPSPSPPPPLPPPAPPPPLPSNVLGVQFNSTGPLVVRSYTIGVLPNAVISVGTCALVGSFCFGDTTLALLGPNLTTVSNIGEVSTIPGGQLATNDDGPSGAGCGTCSYIPPYVYNGTTAATLTVSASCYTGACGGLLVMRVQNTTGGAPPTPPAVAYSPGAPPPNCPPFNLTVGQKFVECVVTVPAYARIMAGTCGLPGAACTGTTSLQVLNGQASTLVANVVGSAEGCVSGGHICSLTPFWLNVGPAHANVTIRQMCALRGLENCTGTTALLINYGYPPPPPSPPPLPPLPPSPPSPPLPAPPSPPPPMPPGSATWAPFDIAIGGDVVTYSLTVLPLTGLVVGTCGVPQTWCTGDTYIAVQAVSIGSEPPVVFDNDNGGGSCGGCSYAGTWTNNYASAAVLTVSVSCADPTQPCSGIAGYSLVFPPPPPSPPPPTPPPPPSPPPPRPPPSPPPSLQSILDSPRIASADVQFTIQGMQIAAFTINEKGQATSLTAIAFLNTLCSNLGIALYICPYTVFYGGVNVATRRRLLSGGVIVDAQVYFTSPDEQTSLLSLLTAISSDPSVFVTALNDELVRTLPPPVPTLTVTAAPPVVSIFASSAINNILVTCSAVEGQVNECANPTKQQSLLTQTAAATSFLALNSSTVSLVADTVLALVSAGTLNDASQSVSLGILMNISSASGSVTAGSAQTITDALSAVAGSALQSSNAGSVSAVVDVVDSLSGTLAASLLDGLDPNAAPPAPLTTSSATIQTLVAVSPPGGGPSGPLTVEGSDSSFDAVPSSALDGAAAGAAVVTNFFSLAFGACSLYGYRGPCAPTDRTRRSVRNHAWQPPQAAVNSRLHGRDASGVCE